MSAQIIPFPRRQEKPSCFVCVHAIAGHITYCTLFKEEILLEGPTAEDCEEYERDPHKR